MNPKIIGHEIQRLVQGQVKWDSQTRDLYSVDASSYSLKPLLVVVPKNEKDVISVLKYASKREISVTARGAGTGLVGSALSSGIILDMKNFDKIKIGSDHVDVDCGVYKGNLDAVLEKNGRFFGPNPSIGAYCTVGGMISTNASGSHSLKYGSTIDNLLQIKMVTHNGKVVKLPSNSKLASDLFNIIKQNPIKRFPAVSKNSCGYRLDSIRTKSDLHKIIAGSEGTLGIIISARLLTRPIPKNKLLVIISYKNVNQAVYDVIRIVKLKPSALEIIDHHITKYFKTEIPKNSKYLLFAEFDHQVRNREKDLQKMIPKNQFFKVLTKNEDVTKWWSLRNSALSYSLRSMAKDYSMPSIIEDATVPVQKLGLLTNIINRVLKKYHIKFVLYGHAGNGNLHIRPILDKKNNDSIKKIATNFFSQVIKIGGTITGEHGDGFARSEFVKYQYGKETYDVFRMIKNKFDPENILNPGKIITTRSTMTKNLKL